jgi:hypothetical protein
MVVQPIIFSLLGCIIGFHNSIKFEKFNPHGISGLILFTGSYVFWMFPRSLDLTLNNFILDKLVHVSAIFNGFFLQKSFFTAPFFLRAAFGIQFLSMISALGIFYIVYENQACISYPFSQQKSTGVLLFCVSVSILLAHLFFIFCSFSRVGGKKKN